MGFLGSLPSVTSLRNVYVTHTLPEGGRVSGITCSRLSMSDVWGVYSPYAVLKVGRECRLRCSPVSVASFRDIDTTYVPLKVAIVSGTRCGLLRVTVLGYTYSPHASCEVNAELGLHGALTSAVSFCS